MNDSMPAASTSQIPFILAPSSRPNSPISSQASLSSSVPKGSQSSKQANERQPGVDKNLSKSSSITPNKAHKSSSNSPPKHLSPAKLKAAAKAADLKILRDKFQEADHYRKKYGMITRGCNIGNGRGCIGRGLPDLISVTSTGFSSGASSKPSAFTNGSDNKKGPHTQRNEIAEAAIGGGWTKSPWSKTHLPKATTSQISNDDLVTGVTWSDSDFAFMELSPEDETLAESEKEAKFHAFERSVSTVTADGDTLRGRLPNSMEEWEKWEQEWVIRKNLYIQRREKRKVDDSRKQDIEQSSHSTSSSTSNKQDTEHSSHSTFDSTMNKQDTEQLSHSTSGTTLSRQDAEDTSHSTSGSTLSMAGPNESLQSPALTKPPPSTSTLITNVVSSAEPTLPSKKQKLSSDAKATAGLSGWGLLTATLSSTKPSLTGTASSSLQKIELKNGPDRPVQKDSVITILNAEKQGQNAGYNEVLAEPFHRSPPSTGSNPGQNPPENREPEEFNETGHSTISQPSWLQRLNQSTTN